MLICSYSEITWRLRHSARIITNCVAFCCSVQCVAGSGVTKGAAFLDKLYVIFLNNHHLFAICKSSYCVGQCPGAKLRKWARHLVYASVYSREYTKDLILMSIMSQLRTAFFFVLALFKSFTLSKPLLSDISCENILALSIVTASLHALFR